MAKKKSSNKNGGEKSPPLIDEAAAEQPDPGSAPTLNVLAQYVKDLSFENPNAPQSLSGGAGNPAIQININVNARALSDAEYEVELILECSAKDGETVVFNIELTYCGIFRVLNVPPESLQPIILIECPRVLFPFARQIIASASRDGGFPPLMIDPIDFAALFRQRMAEHGLEES
jgi:preprotein translocase subunit SecB